MALLIGLVTLLEYRFGWTTGIDEVFLRPPPGRAHVGDGVFRSRMFPATATTFFLLGAALVLFELGLTWNRHRPAEWLSVPVRGDRLAGAARLPLRRTRAVRGRVSSSMALHTSLALLPCSVAILLARPDRGIARVMASATPGGLLTRRLVPVALLMPVATGWIRLEGQQLGLYQTEFGLPLLVCTNIVSFVVFVHWTARGLISLDAARRRSEDLLRQHREYLDITLRSIGDGVISADAAGRVVQINAVAEILTGWSADEARGLLVEEIFRVVDEQTRQAIANPVARVLAEGTVVGLGNEAALIARDGRERSIADSGAPIRDAQAPPAGWSASTCCSPTWSCPG